MKPAARKSVARHLIETFKMSERIACKLADISRTAFLYQNKDSGDMSIITRLKELAAQY